MINNRIAQARMDAGLSASDFAHMLGVDRGTLSNWEAGRRLLTLERLLQISELLSVSASYLLGLDESVSHTEPVERGKLTVLHRMPVWTRSRGWALVNSVKQQFVYADGSVVPFSDMQEPIYMIPPAFALELRGAGSPLGIDGILTRVRVWVEPVTADSDFATELRGWYKPRDSRLVENEYGNRFYLDTYGAKWLAFEDCFGELE